MRRVGTLKKSIASTKLYSMSDVDIQAFIALQNYVYEWYHFDKVVTWKYFIVTLYNILVLNRTSSLISYWVE